MAEQRKQEKKFKDPTGHKGSHKTPVSRIDLIIRGKGPMHNVRYQNGGYQGGSADFGSFDMKQALANVAAGLCTRR